MLQVLTSFCDFLGVSPSLALLVSCLGVVLFGLENKKLEYKIEDEKEKKTIKVYRYK